MKVIWFAGGDSYFPVLEDEERPDKKQDGKRTNWIAFIFYATLLSGALIWTVLSILKKFGGG